ncbi:hypothetical protein METBIDRAFT_40019 [Metschnikowia bicuspidata var. bicuspidata NRRL YB-4993]|uniref:LicD/FKTN/FKRP nucleotidyltransferase domain-containing protein n=1 Tax=Metschnikowia bicuspidata var. bicuspidata NRRL YB-4993 TaxID=869754 RepID=A0A1A0HDR5_9ASCO|nr:hypothetical protein METBIDRAFT_40019 [Metschnikowia bicuspidata var. bicuspidata NRRL YB-4993]OBA22037.1 hypothetical protein METBIDRAFT_40019 [Metschnikowia bicuspidata var. bicuspidata NRRL YB-4993]
MFLSPENFHLKVKKLFAAVASQKDRFWQANSELKHLDVKVQVDNIVAQDESAGPKDIFYDPRVTISVYMNELQQIGDTPELPTLPFHWVDWVDVSMPAGIPHIEDFSCKRLRLRIKGQPDVGKFCKDRNDISDEELETLGFKNRDQLPQAVIFDHCPHENPANNDVRVFMAKSHTMSYLPKPFKVILLNDAKRGGTYEFIVNQTTGTSQRLLYGEMSKRFVLTTLDVPLEEATDHGQEININPKTVHQELLGSVTPHYLAEDADPMGMSRIVKSKPGTNKDIKLEEKHFDYPKERIQEQIDALEKQPLRDVMEQAYLDGLKTCAMYDGTNEPTYFKMALLNIQERRNIQNDWGWHYDWRFFNDALFYDRIGWTKAERIERTNIILERLLRNWNRFAEEKGIVSWIMHGPLLAWYWDGLMFPYDVDIDIQMPISELVRLGRDYNQTLVVENPSEGYGKFLIDVGTYIHNRERSDTGNHIDARFVDVDSGIYIDITGLAKSSMNLPQEYKDNPIVQKADDDAAAEVYNDRRKHFYTLPQLLPLHYSMMGGVPLYIPNQISDRLKWEYSHGTDSYEFHDWFFVPKLQLWITKDKLTAIFNEEDYQNEDGNFDIQTMVTRIQAMDDDDGLELLEDDETLAEYYLTSKFTDWHLHEKAILFTNEGKDNTTAFEDPRTLEMYNNLVGKVGFSKPLRNSLFEYEAFERTAHS